MGFKLGKSDVGTEVIDDTPEPPKELEPYLWGPILRGLCTLHETETVYSLDDIITMNIALEHKDYMARFYREHAEAKAKKGATR